MFQTLDLDTDCDLSFDLEPGPETLLTDLIVTTPHQRSVRWVRKLISPPAQKPAFLPGGCRAGLVGIPASLGLRPSRVFALSLQLVEPSGWWVNASSGDLVRRISALRHY